MMKSLVFIMLLASISVFAQEKTIGSFIATRDSGVGLTAADIDGDGDIDVLVATPYEQKVKAIINNGSW